MKKFVNNNGHNNNGYKSKIKTRPGKFCQMCPSNQCYPIDNRKYNDKRKDR